MKLEDLLVRHNKTDLFQKRANFQLEDFRYDQIARAALDKAICVIGMRKKVGVFYTVSNCRCCTKSLCRQEANSGRRMGIYG